MRISRRTFTPAAIATCAVVGYGAFVHHTNSSASQPPDGYAAVCSEYNTFLDYEAQSKADEQRQRLVETANEGAISIDPSLSEPQKQQSISQEQQRLIALVQQYQAQRNANNVKLLQDAGNLAAKWVKEPDLPAKLDFLSLPRNVVNYPITNQYAAVWGNLLRRIDSDKTCGGRSPWPPSGALPQIRPPNPQGVEL